MTITKPQRLTVSAQKEAASDAVLFSGPYNVLDGGDEVIQRHLPTFCLDWTRDERETAVAAVRERAYKLAQTIIERYGR